MDLTQIILVITEIIGAATLIFRGLEQLAKLTKSQKDDAIIKKCLAFCVKLSSYIALNKKV